MLPRAAEDRLSPERGEHVVTEEPPEGTGIPENRGRIDGAGRSGPGRELFLCRPGLTAGGGGDRVQKRFVEVGPTTHHAYGRSQVAQPEATLLELVDQPVRTAPLDQRRRHWRRQLRKELLQVGSGPAARRGRKRRNRPRLQQPDLPILGRPFAVRRCAEDRLRSF